MIFYFKLKYYSYVLRHDDDDETTTRCCDERGGEAREARPKCLCKTTKNQPQIREDEKLN